MADRSLKILVTANLAQMKAELNKADSAIASTSSALKRMGESFSGAKTIADANAMVNAVQSVGGVTKLTESEQRRLNVSLTEGIAKYQALGKQAPAEMLALRDATNKAIPPTKELGASAVSLTEKLKGVAGTLGLAFGATAVVAGVRALVTNTLQYAGTIDDTSKKLGISAEATQRYKFAADQTGASLENVAKSVVKLSVNLAGGKDSVRESLAAAGLEFNTIRAMKPEAAFDATVAAIQRIPDPMTQARVALELFGKGGAELLPAIREGFAGVASGAKVMSDQTIERLAKAEDAWAELGASVTIVSGELISGTASVVARMTESWKSFFKFSEIAFKHGFSAALVYADSLDMADAAMNRLTDGQKEFIADRIKIQGNTPAVIAGVLGVSEATVRAHIATLKAAIPPLRTLTDEQIAAAKAAKKFAEEVQGQRDKFNGIIPVSKAWVALMKEMGMAVSVLPSGKGAPSFFDMAPQYRKSLSDMTLPLSQILSYGKQLGALKPPPPQVWSFLPGVRTEIDLATGEVKDGGEKVGKSFLTGLSSSMENLPNVIVGAIQGGGNVYQAAIASIGAGIGSDLTKKIKKSMGGGMLGSLLGGLAGTGVTLLASGLGKLFGSKGRDDVKAWVSETYGSFDALRKKMLELPGGGEALWKTLTQGVGKNNPQQAAAAIKAIEDAFEAARLKGEATAEATKKITDEIDDMKGRLSDLQATANPTFDDLVGYANEFGVSLSGAGQAFQQMSQNAEATKLINAFDGMKRGGLDVGNTINGMSDEISKFVVDSLQFKTVVPENMRFMIEAAMNAGQLINENGEKLTDMSRINFGEPIKSKWEIIGDEISKLTEAIKAMVEQLRGPVVAAVETAIGAFNGLPTEWNFDVKPNFGMGGGTGVKGGEFGGAMATGGSGLVTRPTWFLAGEAGPERFNFTPVGRSGNGGGSGVNVVINNPVVRKDSDIREITRQVASELVRYTDLIGVRG